MTAPTDVQAPADGAVEELTGLVERLRSFEAEATELAAVLETDRPLAERRIQALDLDRAQGVLSDDEYRHRREQEETYLANVEARHDEAVRAANALRARCLELADADHRQREEEAEAKLTAARAWVRDLRATLVSAEAAVRNAEERIGDLRLSRAEAVAPFDPGMQKMLENLRRQDLETARWAAEDLKRLDRIPKRLHAAACAHAARLEQERLAERRRNRQRAIESWEAVGGKGSAPEHMYEPVEP